MVYSDEDLENELNARRYDVIFFAPGLYYRAEYDRNLIPYMENLALSIQPHLKVLWVPDPSVEAGMIDKQLKIVKAERQVQVA